MSFFILFLFIDDDELSLENDFINTVGYVLYASTIMQRMYVYTTRIIDLACMIINLSLISYI